MKDLMVFDNFINLKIELLYVINYIRARRASSMTCNWDRYLILNFYFPILLCISSYLFRPTIFTVLNKPSPASMHRLSIS